MVPTWDGAPKGWRRYCKEVAWYVRGNKQSMRKYLATRLISKLTGTARLLAMSWSQAEFDTEDGVTKYLRKLAQSPLVRRSMPNAAAIMSQYFSFKRYNNEKVADFLVRETLGFEEFQEALIRLKQERSGVDPSKRTFGLPAPEERDRDDDLQDWWSPSQWDRWRQRGGSRVEDASDTSSWRRSRGYRRVSQEEDAPDADGDGLAEEPAPSEGEHQGDPQESQAASPQAGHRDSAEAASQGGRRESATPGPSPVAVGEEDELNVMDSFIINVLRGWRLLVAASLSPEEWRDILSATNGRLDYDSISDALQTLWDEQLTATRFQPSLPGHHLHVAEADHYTTYVEDTPYEDWGDEWGDGWNAGWQYHVGWRDDDSPVWEPAGVEHGEDADDPRLQELQKAEQDAEVLAMEAKRTWSQAQQATAAMRRERGFIPSASARMKGSSGCFICGGNHMARECPDRQHPGVRKGKGFGGKPMGGKFTGKHMNYADTDWHWDLVMAKGKNKNKNANWTAYDMAYAFPHGKNKGKFKGSKGSQVNAYVADYYGLEMEVDGQTRGDLHAAEAQSAKVNAERKPSQGMLDTGATASAGPEGAVRGLIQALLAKDPGATIKIDQSRRPYFRFGSGKWGRGEYHVDLQSTASGKPRSFSVYVLPNPSNYQDNEENRSLLVPVLVGMDFAGDTGTGMVVDLVDGTCVFSLIDPLQHYTLQQNSKGHYMVDLVEYLTGGVTVSKGHANIIILQERHVSFDVEVLELHVVLPEVDRGELFRQLLQRRSELNQSNPAARRLRLMQPAPKSSVEPPSSPVPVGGHGRKVAGLPGGADEAVGVRKGGEEADGRPGEGPSDGAGWTGSSSVRPAMAMLWNARANAASVQQVGNVDALQSMCPAVDLPAQEGSPVGQYGGQESPGREAGAEAAGGGLCDHEGHPADGGDGAGRDRKTHHEPAVRGRLGQVQEQAGGREAYEEGLSDDSLGTAVPYKRRKFMGSGGGARDAYARARDPQAHHHGGTYKAQGGDARAIAEGPGGCRDAHHGSDEENVTSGELKRDIPKYVASQAIEMQKDAQRHLAINVQEMLYGEEDALWEFFCAPDSWLTFAAERDGLKAMRVNLANDMDLYRPDTYQVLEKLAATKRPRRLWVSMPCTKWSSWARLNYHDRPEQLTKFRRRERKMMRLFANWLSKTLESGQRPEYYHEWPTHCDGWNVQEMGQIQRILEYFGYRVFWCRIDGCRYNLRSRDGKQLLRKQWTIMTTDERFYAMFRSKTCVGGHDHGEIAGVETASTAYYPWNLCRSIARLWRQQEVPDRVLKKLWIKEAIDITDEKYLEMVLHAAEAEPDAEEGEAVEDVREEEAVGGAEPTEAEKQVWLTKIKKFHAAAGHPGNRNLARMVRDAGRPAWQIRMVMDYKCPHCEALRPGGSSSGRIPPASTKPLPKAWSQVGIDLSEWLPPNCQKKYKFILFMDMATKYKVIDVIKSYPMEQQQVESADDVIKSFALRWLLDKPKPEYVIPDSAKTLTSNKLREYMSDLNIALTHPAEKESWAHGVIESAIKDIKNTANYLDPDFLCRHGPGSMLSDGCSGTQWRGVRGGL